MPPRRGPGPDGLVLEPAPGAADPQPFAGRDRGRRFPEDVVTEDSPTVHALKAAALDAVRRRWHLFPLRPGSTEPALRDWAQRATANPLRIGRFWDTQGPHNIGLVPCASGLVVLELAAAPPGELPPPA